MFRYLIYPFSLFVLVGGYFFIRKLVDRQVEKSLDMEVVREGEEYLGTWASKSPTGFVMFRLRRDGTINYTINYQNQKDSTKITGKYQLIPAGGGRSVHYYPRLIAVSDQGDTIFNFYQAYLTSYGSTIDKTDKMVLNPNNMFDTAGFVFYRIKQN